MQKLLTIGMLLIFLGTFFIFWAILHSAQIGSQSGSTTKVAVGGFIGPVPFGFMTDKSLYWPFIIIMASLLALLVVLRYLIR